MTEASLSWQHQYLSVNQVRLHYVTQGSGDLVILLHGFPEFWYSWRFQIPVLARHFKVVVPDPGATMTPRSLPTAMISIPSAKMSRR